MEILTRKNMIVKDTELLKKFNSFRDGMMDMLSYLYIKNNNYYLLLSPYDSLVLDRNICIKFDDLDSLLVGLDELTCNLGFMILENNKLGYKKSFNHSIISEGTRYCLVNYNDLYIKDGFRRRRLYCGEELKNKISSSFEDVFGSDRSPLISPYIYNMLYSKTTLYVELSSFENEVLDYYKRRGYEFINSFLGNSTLKVSSLYEKIDCDFIDKLFCLYDLFEKFPALEKDLVVFRGTTEEEALSSNYNSFISTSLDLKVASSFSNSLLYEIAVRKGSFCIPVDSIERFSSIFGETEAEILLRPGEFEIIDSGTKNDFNYIKVIHHEKKDFSLLVIDALERRKDELIEKSLCDEETYLEVLNYVNEKRKIKTLSLEKKI